MRVSSAISIRSGAVTVTGGLVLLVYALVDTTNVGWGRR